LCKVNLDVLPISRLSKPYFVVKFVRFRLTFVVSPSVAQGSEHTMECGVGISLKREGLTAECEGELGTLGAIHLNSPMPAPALNGGKVVLERLGSGVWVRVSSEDASIVSKGS
jgi:hypothetical protein